MPIGGEQWARRTCDTCGREKALPGFRSTRLAGEVVTTCRACEDAAGDPDAQQRAANRERVAAQAGLSYDEVKRTPQPPRMLRSAQQDTIADPAVPLVVPPAPPAFPVPPTVPKEERPYPALRAVLRYLPAAGTWTADDRARFFAALEAAIDLEIRVMPLQGAQSQI